MKQIGTLLQLNELTWSTISHQQLSGRIMTVLFAYGIVVWNRFGLLTFTQPRAPLRVMLVGIYGWLALALVIWLLARYLGTATVGLREATIAASIVQIPIVALGFFMAIVAGFARVLGPGVVLASFVFAIWVPLLLARAFRDVAGLKWPAAATAAAAFHLAWLVGPGRHFHDQVGHLL